MKCTMNRLLITYHNVFKMSISMSKYESTSVLCTVYGQGSQNCIIGQKFCLHHITGTAFIIRLKLNVYIVENSDTFQKIYTFMQFK